MPMKKFAFAFASLIIMMSLVVVHAARDVVVDKNVNQVLPVYTLPSAEQIVVADVPNTPSDYIYSYNSEDLPVFDTELISYPLLFRYAMITDEDPVFMEPPGNSVVFGTDIYNYKVHHLCTDNRPLSRPIKQC